MDSGDGSLSRFSTATDAPPGTILFASKCHLSDVDVVFTEDSPDETNQSRHVTVSIDQQQAVKIRFEMVLVQSHQSQELIAKDRARMLQMSPDRSSKPQKPLTRSSHSHHWPIQ